MSAPARRLVASYCFPPYSDTAAVVAAKRVHDRGEPVDVICNAMDSIRQQDPDLVQVCGSLVRRFAAVPSRTAFSSWGSVVDYQQRGLVAFVESEQPHQATCWQRFLPTGPLAFLPFADDGDSGRDGHTSSIVWTLPDAEAERLLHVDDGAFLRELEAAFAGTLGALKAVSARAAFPLRRQLAQAYGSGRVVVAGDAAHVVHPLAGQGVNLGLRDVSTLRRALHPARSRHADPRQVDPGAPQRLARWARQQRSDNALAAYAFDGLNRLFSNDTVAATLLRGPLLGLVGRLPPLTHAFWRHAAGR